MTSQTTVNTEGDVPFLLESFHDSATAAHCETFGHKRLVYHSYVADVQDLLHSDIEQGRIVDAMANPMGASDNSYLCSDYDDSDETPLLASVSPPYDPNASCGSQQVVAGDTTPQSVVNAVLVGKCKEEAGPSKSPVVDDPIITKSPVVASQLIKPPAEVDALSKFLKVAEVRTLSYLEAVKSGQRQAGHEEKPVKVVPKSIDADVKPGFVPKPIFNWCKQHNAELLSKLNKSTHNSAARAKIATEIIELHSRTAGKDDADREIKREKEEGEQDAVAAVREAEKPRIVMQHTFGPGDVVPAEMLATCETYTEVRRNIDACLQREGLIKNVGTPDRVVAFRMPLLFTFVPYLWLALSAILATSLVALRVTSGFDRIWWLAFWQCSTTACFGKLLVWWPDDRDRAITARGDYIKRLRQRNAFGLLLMACSAVFPLCTFICGLFYLTALNEYSHWLALIWVIQHITPMLFSAASVVVCALCFRNTLLDYCATEFEIEKQVRIMHTVDYKQIETGPPTAVKVTHSWKIRDDRSEEAKMQDMAIPYCHVGTYLMRCVLNAEVQLPVEGTAAGACDTTNPNDHVQGWMLTMLTFALSLLTNTVEQSHSYHLEWLLQCISARSSSALLTLETRMAKIDMMAQTFNKVNWPTYTRLGIQSAPLGTNALAAFIIESSIHLLRQTHAGGFTPRASSHGVAN